MRVLLSICETLLLFVIIAANHNRTKSSPDSFSSSSSIGSKTRPGAIREGPVESNHLEYKGEVIGSEGIVTAVNTLLTRVTSNNSVSAIINTRQEELRKEDQSKGGRLARPTGTPYRGTCGVREEEHRSPAAVPPAAPRRLTRREAARQDRPKASKLLRLSGGDVRGTRRYVEAHVVADLRLYHRMDADYKKVENFVAGVISYTNAVFEPLEISVVLKQLEIWRTGDKIAITSNHDSTLDNFKPHRIGLLRKGFDSDVTVLLTDMDFEGTTIGYALVSSMCSSTAIAVVQTHDSDVVSVSHTVAHELGHVLGMNHDKSFCTCDDMSCVMYEELNGAMKPAVKWSNCSKIHLASHFVHGEFSCLQDIPSVTQRRVEFCGDGVVDQEEQCDCGPPDMCSNPCCDPYACTFRPNATCASGSCCDLQTCHPAATSTPCRQSRSECDLPEFCSGWSETCPPDSYVYDGFSCDDGQGHCVAGKCGSHRIRCETLFGPGAVPSPDRCFANNVLGGEGQNCGMYRSSITYRRCDRDSVKCGSIYCNPVTRLIIPRAGVMLWQNSAQCFTSYAHNISAVPELELAPDGSTCGDGRMCSAQQCIAVPSPPEGCGHGECGDRGVCNNRGRCHCDAGYAPPDCTGPGFGGSVDSGHMSDPTVTADVDRMLFLILLVFVPLICGLCALFCCLNVYWTNHKKQVHHRPYPLEDQLDSFFCCLSESITRALTENGILGKPNPSDEELSGDPSETEKLNPPLSERRKTICKVDVDIQAPKPEPNSWGTANDALFTDVVTVTPRSSPDLHRRVRLPSDSPLLHHKSQDQLQRPKYDKSFSSDSGCVSDIEEQRDKADTNMSMSSLMNLVMKVGKGKRSREGSSEPEARNTKQYVSQKSVPLSRLVLDPYAPKTNVKQESDSSLLNNRPSFNRSLSSDAATTHSVKLNIPESGFLTPKKSSTSINTVSSSDSESFYVNCPSENQIKEEEIHSTPGIHSKLLLDKSGMKPTQKHTGVVPSRKAPSAPSHADNQQVESTGRMTSQEKTKSSPKKPMLPPNRKKQTEIKPRELNSSSLITNHSTNSSSKPSITLPKVELKPVREDSKQSELALRKPSPKSENEISNRKKPTPVPKNHNPQTSNSILSTKNDAPRKPMFPPDLQKLPQPPWNEGKRTNLGTKNQDHSPGPITMSSVSGPTKSPLKIPPKSEKPSSHNLATANNDTPVDANEFLTKFREMKSGTPSNSSAINPVVQKKEVNPVRKPMMPPKNRLL
ncbi:ADAM cysteine-rich [Trinorchestia longiramus]|nr:ADAM cysteine-rich [Trinorchestia longiramus]